MDYTHPSGDGDPPWSNDPDERFAFDPNFDEFGDYTQSAIHTLHILDYSSPTLASCSTIMANQHVISSNQHAVNNEPPDYEKSRPYFGWVKDDSSITLTRANQHVVRYNQHHVNQDTPDYEKFWPYFGWVNVDTVQKTMETVHTMGSLHTQYIPYEKALKI